MITALCISDTINSVYVSDTINSVYVSDTITALRYKRLDQQCLCYTGTPCSREPQHHEQFDFHGGTQNVLSLVVACVPASNRSVAATLVLK